MGEIGLLGSRPVTQHHVVRCGLLLLVTLFCLDGWGQASAKRSQKAGAATSVSVVRGLQVEGLRKIDEKAVLNKVSSKAGEPLRAERVRQDILEIYKMGFFSDIQVELTGAGVLLFKLQEKPSLVEIKFEGFSEVKEDDLKEAAGIRAFEILDLARIQTATEKVQKFYEGKGYFLAKVESKIEEVTPGESVRVVFSVSEGENVKVQKITFLGNQQLTDGFLKGRMATSEGGFFSFMSGSGGFKQEAFERDLQVLRLTYMNEGFIQAKIDRPQVFVTPDRKSIYITFRIEEGERYEVGEVDFAGDLLFSRQELQGVVQIGNQKHFSYEIMQKDLGELQAKYGDLGYAYANVIPRTRLNEKERIVDITFEFDKGTKVYFGQFTITGNTKTRDKVIRRELRILEGELFNETRRRKSIENIQRLGFFEEVNLKTSANPQDPDRMDIEIVVKERNTGSLQAGAGYGSSTGLTLQGSVNQSNFLGKGQRLSASLNSSQLGAYYNFNFTEPNYNDTDWLVGVDVYQSGIDRYEYEDLRIGAGLRIGKPIGEQLMASLRYRLDRTDLRSKYDANGTLLTDQTLFPLETASGLTSSLTASIEFDQRDDRFSPSKGHFASTSFEYAGLGGDLRYTKTNLTYRYFKNIFWDVIWRNNLTHSYLASHDPNVEPPFNERFLLGGPYSLRGYRFYRVGRTVFSQSAYDRFRGPDFNFSDEKARTLATKPFGGTQQLMFQTELEFPMIKEAGIKGVVFFDIGQAEDTLTPDNFYSDVGFGFRWFSPIGPLRFEWGFPLRDTPTSQDRVLFDFSIGSPF